MFSVGCLPYSDEGERMRSSPACRARVHTQCAARTRAGTLRTSRRDRTLMHLWADHKSCKIADDTRTIMG